MMFRTHSQFESDTVSGSHEFGFRGLFKLISLSYACSSGFKIDLFGKMIGNIPIGIKETIFWSIIFFIILFVIGLIFVLVAL